MQYRRAAQYKVRSDHALDRPTARVPLRRHSRALHQFRLALFASCLDICHFVDLEILAFTVRSNIFRGVELFGVRIAAASLGAPCFGSEEGVDDGCVDGEDGYELSTCQMCYTCFV
jgi:hypothetical protein